MGLNKMYKMNW